MTSHYAQLTTAAQAAVVLAHEVVAYEILGVFEWAVVEQKFGGDVGGLISGVDQLKKTHGPLKAEVADLNADLTVTDAVLGLEANVAGGIEVTLICVVRTFAEVDTLNRFRDNEVEVGVALAVGVAGHVDGHSVYAQCYVGTVVDIKAAQENLFGLTATGVLADEKTRYTAQDFLAVLHRR